MRQPAPVVAVVNSLHVQTEKGVLVVMSGNCAICGRGIEPEARYFTTDGFPRHMLCEEPSLCGACGQFHAEGECDLDPENQAERNN